MVRKKPKPVYDELLDGGELSDNDAKDFILATCMNDISEILARAYQDIEDKVKRLVEDLEDK